MPPREAVVIPSIDPLHPGLIEIAIDEADNLYREIRVENSGVDEQGTKTSLELGDELDIVMELNGKGKLKNSG